jgi:hypothetical protein
VPKNIVWAGGTDLDAPCYTVRSQSGRMVLVLSGGEAPDAAVDWIDKGYEVDETTWRVLAVRPPLRRKVLSGQA